MQLRESTVARLGLVALALVEWRHAALLVWGGLMPAHPAAIALVLALYLTSFGLILQALARRELDARAARWIVLPGALALAAFLFQDSVHRIQADIYPTTDAHAYMDVAARLLVKGQNPYVHSLLDGFRIFRLPMRFATPLVDGDFSDRVAYPAFSFLFLVPLVLAHVPTYLAYGVCFCAALLLVIRETPWWARALVFAFFLHEETFVMMTFGGVTDSVWMLCFVGAILAWSRRPVLAAVLVGLACAQKQHAWFFVPYLLVRICREERVRPWEGAARRFLAIVAGVFLALNLPFALWGPKAWVIGITEPLVAPMIQLSEGLTALSMTGYVRIPRGVTSALFWLLYAYSLFVYARHARRLRDWCWFLPAAVLWFGYRALMSYWYFNALLAVAALVAPVAPVVAGEAEDPDDAAKWTLTRRLGLGLAALFALALGFSAARKEPFEVTVLGPLDAWETHVFRVRVRVKNLMDHPTAPRFIVQGAGVQPMQWLVDLGWNVDPGKTEEYVIRATKPYNGFEITTGARLAVADRHDPGLRSYTTIPADVSVMRFDTIPNGRFAYMDVKMGVPYGWSVDTTDDGVHLDTAGELDRQQRVAFAFEAPPVAAEAPSAAAADPKTCFPTQRIEKVKLPAVRTGEVATTLEMPLSEVDLDVKVPAGANQPPYAELYGLHLAVPDWNGYVLFDAPVPRGTLPSGAPFVSRPAPRGAWVSVHFRVEDVLRELGAPLERRRFSFQRFPDLDVPALPVQIGLFASKATGATGTVVFGQLVSRDEGLHETELVERGLAAGPARDAWRGAREMDHGNFDHAAELVERAVRAEPTFDRELLLGDVELHAGHPDRARDAYRRALALHDSAEAEKGLAWALYHGGDLQGAVAHFERSRDGFAKVETTRPRGHYADALRGLVVVHAKLGACDASRAAAAAALAENPYFPPPVTPECPR